MITDEWQAGLSLREAFAALQASPPDVDWRRAPRLFDNIGAAFNRNAARSAGQSERVSLPTIIGKRLKSLGFERDVALGKEDRDALPFRRKIPACSLDLTINFQRTSGYGIGKMFEVQIGVVPRDGGQWFQDSLLLAFGQNPHGWMWACSTSAELAVAIDGIERVFLAVAPILENSIACPGEMTCRLDLDRGVALRDARQVAMAWSSDARPFAEQSGFGRIYGSYAALSAGSASFSLRARTVQYFSENRGCQLNVEVPEVGSALSYGEYPIDRQFFYPQWLEP